MMKQHQLSIRREQQQHFLFFFSDVIQLTRMFNESES